MRAELFSIGTELLLGQIIDTNAAFLAQGLAGLGVPCFFKTTVGDNPARLVGALRLARERSTVIICTGGLGPTGDDITAASIAEAFDAPLELNEEAFAGITHFFTVLGREVTANQRKQALIPAGAEIIPNPVGTAPGFILTRDGVTVIAMPGPPNEMIPMWNETVAPYLRGRSGGIIHSRTLRFVGIGEGALEERLRGLIDAQGEVTIAPYAKLAEVHIRLTAKAETVEEAAAMIAPVEVAVREITGEFIYGVDDETLEEVVGTLLHRANRTLAVAESCTGGLLGGRITAVPGSSIYFLGGVIAYSNDVKRNVLGVNADTLGDHGAVSEETAREMADGVMRALGADIGVSITGVAGPGGGTSEKPVGLVYIGLAAYGELARTVRLLAPGDRETVRRRATQEALVALWRFLRAREDNT